MNSQNQLANLDAAALQVLQEAEQRIRTQTGQAVALVAYQTAE